MDNKTGEVQVYKENLVLPTYPIKGENRNPVFRSQYGVAHIYPYTLLDDIDDQKRDVTYQTLVLENDYLKLIVLPDLGGRVYSLFDKVSNKEVFYKNSVVRFAPLAIRGAFFSGGLEFSFPVAHAPTTCDKVNWDIHKNKDGSGSISIGGLEHISGLRWMITLSLYPDRCALSQDVYLFNPGMLPGRYHYWTNASLDANDQTEFIYPLHRARSYEFAGSASWPYARLDLIQNDPGLPGMEGVPMWPASRLQNIVNFRWQKNMLAQVSIFGRNVSWDYFGAWQHSENYGYAHVAKSKDVSGMKLWSWGNAPVGVVNQTSLTDDGSVYAETQCGAMETQLDFDFLIPGETRKWREWWIPLRGLDGLTCASENMGVKVAFEPVDPGDSMALRIAVCPSATFNNANINIHLADKEILSKTISISPEKPWEFSLPLKASEVADKPITILVTDSQGAVLIKNIISREADPVNEPVIETEKSSDSANYYKEGLKHENFDNREQAKESYKKSTHEDGNNKEAHFQFALMLLRSADLVEAENHFSIAHKLGKHESVYYLGYIALLQNKLVDAEKYFKIDGQSGIFRDLCLLGLGKVKLRAGEIKEAAILFEKASKSTNRKINPLLMEAIANRLLGNFAKAEGILEEVLGQDFLNPVALYELSLGNSDMSQAAADRIQRYFSDDYQYYLDLANFYYEAGVVDEAYKILEKAWMKKEYVMIGYLCSYLAHLSGNLQLEDQWLGKIRQISLDFGFPGRLVEVLSLEYAVNKNGQDNRAKYLLGNFYYAHERFDEAIKLWEEALVSLPSFDVLLRNLGLAYWQRKNDQSTAIEYFEKAQKANPLNQDIYLHLDDLYKAQGEKSKRHQLLQWMNNIPSAREDIRKHRIKMMVELGQYKEALEIITTQKFIPLEMDQSFHNVYVQALQMEAKDHLNNSRLEDAARCYEKMLLYPDNQGVGAPTNMAQAAVYYHLGCIYEKMGRFSDALKVWKESASEYHHSGDDLFQYVQLSLDKLSRYSELGMEI